MPRWAGHLRSSGVLRHGVTVERAADILSVHMDPRLYECFITYRGWTGRQYEIWYTEVSAATLLRPTDGI
jgi:hypothetical protein